VPVVIRNPPFGKTCRSPTKCLASSERFRKGEFIRVAPKRENNNGRPSNLDEDIPSPTRPKIQIIFSQIRIFFFGGDFSYAADSGLRRAIIPFLNHSPFVWTQRLMIELISRLLLAVRHLNKLDMSAALERADASDRGQKEASRLG
jgi:hypothetical protein